MGKKIYLSLTGDLLFIRYLDLKKRILLIVLGALAAASAGAYFFYEYWYKKDTVEAWSLVPESALAVYETSRFPDNWQQLTGTSLWNNLSAIPAFDSLAQRMTTLDSVYRFQDFFVGRQALVSMHIIASDAWDYAYFFKLDKARDQKAMRTFLDSLNQTFDLQRDQRTYNGFTIHELSDRKSRRFSYILYKDIFAGSFTPFLVEDMIRNIDTGLETYSFEAANPDIRHIPKLADDAGNLYINTRKLPLLLSVFAGKEAQPAIQPLAHLAQAMFLDVTLSGKQLMLSGFSTVPATPDSSPSMLLNTFQGQSPGGISMASYIPERTAILTHMTFSNPVAWQHKLYAYQQQSADVLTRQSQQRRNEFQAQQASALPAFFMWFQGEAGVLWLESTEVSAPDKMVIIQVKDTAKIQQACQQINQAAALEETPYRENFSGYQIHEIQHKEFPAALLGPVALGFEQCFYLIAEDYWIMANRVSTLKRMILDREAESTWNKSVLFNRFLESTVDQANLSYIVNTARAWPMILHSLSPEWQEYARQYAATFKTLEHLAVQFSESDNEFYTSVVLGYTDKAPKTPQNKPYQTLQRVALEHTASTRPFLVKNHISQAWEVVIEDDSNYFYLASAEGEILWRDSLPGKIISDVQQIDFFNNGKLQYLFATENAIHLIDRNGDAIEGYPLYMPEEVEIRYLSLFDYDNSKKYRFLVTDPAGKLWMYNKDRENLEGWNPRVIESPLAAAPVHIRIRDKDFILAIQQNGTINLLSRQGQNVSGFPINLNTPVQSGAFVAPGSSLESTILTTVTRQGEKFAFNLLGRATQREQLYRPSSRTRFSLRPDALGKTYVIVRQDENRVGILDKEGTLLFEKDYISPSALTSDRVEVQYYDFGTDQQLYAITDEVQEFTYLFNTQGKLLKDRPIESKFGVSVLFYEDQRQYRIYRSYADEYAVVAFSE